MSHFYLTLPSNSSRQFFSENTLTHFKTKLHTDFNLNGEWEVGLSEVHFPRNWHNIDDNQGISIICNDCNEVEPAFTSNPKRRNYSQVVPITAGYYSTMEEIINEINASLEKAYELPILAWKQDETNYIIKQSARPKFHYNKANRKVSVHLHSKMFIRFSPQLADILGISLAENPIKNNTIEAVKHRFTRVSDVERGIHSIYVYCDLLEAVPVGDTLAPLLRICDAQGTYGNTVHRYFDKPIYVPLQKKLFDTIEIDIRDNLGNPIPFEAGNLVVTLHFRRCKDNYLY